MAIELRLLGPVEASIAGRMVDVGHARQQCVLAALLIDAEQLKSVNQLLDHVWGDRPPQRARGSLQSYLSRLRKVLAPEVAIVRRPDGYLLRVSPETVDVWRFRDLVRTAAERDDEHAATVLAEALSLWRGDAFGALDTPWLNTVRDGLHDERFTAQLELSDHLLRLGRHAELVGRLAVQALDHPWDERLAVQHMLALYRCGRQADALDTYERLRRLLAEELGTDPSPPLRLMHLRILRGDPSLAAPGSTVSLSDLPRGETSRPAGSAPAPRQLPSIPRTFTGRSAELTQLDRALHDPAANRPLIAAVTGGGGMGKTWLALHWAAANRERYPDGQLYVDLRGFDPTAGPLDPNVALRGFLEALAVDPSQIPPALADKSGLFRTLVANRTMLILVDNVRDHDSVVPLLPGTGTSAVLVTSRRRLTSLAVTHGARVLSVDAMPDRDAHDLLQRQVGRDLTSVDRVAADQLIEHCAGLPLALSIVGAKAALRPDLPLGVLAADMHESSARLDALNGGELAVDLRGVLSCSHSALTPQAARLFDLLGLAQGPDISLSAVTSLAFISRPEAHRVLEELVVAHLLTEHRPERYRMHDLVRLYAAECAPRDPHAVRRLLDHYLHTAHAAALLLSPHREPLALADRAAGAVVDELPDLDAATGWFTIEHQALVAAVGQAAESGLDAHTHQLAWTMATYLDRRGNWHDWVLVQHVAVAAAQRSRDLPAWAQAHRLLANAYSNGRQYDDSIEHLNRALEVFAQSDDAAGQAHVHFDIALLCDRDGRPADAAAHAVQALTFYRAVPHPLGEAVALNALGWYHCQLGDFRTGIKHCEQSLSQARDIDSDYGQSNALDSLGYAHHRLGEHAPAIAYYREAIELFRNMGDLHNGAIALDHLGDAYRETEDLMRAQTAWREALGVFNEIDPPTADRVRTKLGETG